MNKTCAATTMINVITLQISTKKIIFILITCRTEYDKILHVYKLVKDLDRELFGGFKFFD